jgi:S1-C subfamily serine protease
MLKQVSAVALSVLLSVSSVLGLISWHTSQINQAFTVASQATYTVELGYNADAIMGSCSGVLIKDSVLLTAAHCKYDYIKVNGKKAEVLKFDEAADLLLLKVDAHCPCVPVSQGRVFKGQTIYTYGYPFGKLIGFTKVLTKGTIQDLVINPEIKEIEGHMLSVLPIAPGNSGGGIFAFEDGKLRVVSVVSRGAIHWPISPTLYMVQKFTTAPW